MRERRSPQAELLTPITAASQILRGEPRQQYAVTYRSWQEELWAYYASVGEFASVINWFSAGFARMHLRAAVWKPGLTEPEFLTEGRAAELVQEMSTKARGGETQFLRSWAQHLSVPGVGYLIVKDTVALGRTYEVKSADVIKRSGRTVPNRKSPSGEPLEVWQVRTDPDRWTDLDPHTSYITRIYDPDPREDFLPTSMTKAAIATLREIDLLNKAIVAQLVSRLAFNGILLIPEEVTFPVNPQFKDAPDPFIAEFIAVASKGIRDPGAPSSAIPMPLRVNHRFIDSFKHLILSQGLDPKIIDARQAAVDRLSEQLPAPPEAMTGISDMNHWNAASQSRENVQLYFSPPMEILCGGLTENWLHPTLIAEDKPLTDEDGNPIVVWYDASDLTRDVDNSDNAAEARKNHAITDDRYREVMGFDKADKPSDKERRLQILTDLASQGSDLPDSYFLLYPDDRKELDKIMPPPPALVNANAADGTAGDGAEPGNTGLSPGEEPSSAARASTTAQPKASP